MTDPRPTPPPSVASSEAPPSSSASVDALVAAAGTDRRALERLRDQFQARISRRSDDFEATKGLRLTEAALRKLPRDGDPWDHAVRKLVRD